jgi:arginyl-tRNA synthetase
MIGALRYVLLKNRLGSDVAFDVNEAISLDGNSGPYLQYAHVRARSIIKKSTLKPAEQITQLEPAERGLLAKMAEYPEVMERAVGDLMPHLICNYLYELAQVFNNFYEHNRVIGDQREVERLMLVSSYANVLEEGLNLLGIPAPQQM